VHYIYLEKRKDDDGNSEVQYTIIILLLLLPTTFCIPFPSWEKDSVVGKKKKGKSS